MQSSICPTVKLRRRGSGDFFGRVVATLTDFSHCLLMCAGSDLRLGDCEEAREYRSSRIPLACPAIAHRHCAMHIRERSALQDGSL